MESGWVYLGKEEGWFKTSKKMAKFLNPPAWKLHRAKKNYLKSLQVTKPKAFANPLADGYGREEWPFSKTKALKDGRYRAGVRNAIRADWTDGYWKYQARKLMYEVLDILTHAQLAAEDASN